VRAAYLATLGVAYGRGDLSLVYPLARGIAPVLVPPVAVLVLGEGHPAPRLVGAALILVGVLLLGAAGA